MVVADVEEVEAEVEAGPGAQGGEAPLGGAGALPGGGAGAGVGEGEGALPTGA